MDAKYSRNSSVYWLKLNWAVPIDEILSEYNSLHRDDLVVHRPDDGHKDWFAVCLYGYGSNRTKSHWEYLHLRKPKSLTNVGKKCPRTMAWVQSMPFARLDDVRFLVIKPHGYIKPHVDVPDQNWLEPVNIAISWPEGCKFTFTGKGQVPYESGTAFLLNVHYEHGVTNDSDQERVHLVIHGKKKDEFWSHVVQSS